MAPQLPVDGSVEQHFHVEGAQSPVLLGSQVAPVSVRLLSMVRSQSSSRWLRTWRNGDLAQGGHDEVQQLPEPPPPQLSMMPSQSSSLPLQVSTPGQMRRSAHRPGAVPATAAPLATSMKVAVT